MKPATQISDISTRFAAAVLIAAMSLVVSQKALAGREHHIESAPHRCAGCIDGSCGVPAGPYGHYRGSWRRWPGSKDSVPGPGRKQGTSPREPIVPDPFEEGRTRPRTRSDKPLEPDEIIGGMNGGAGQFDPIVPGPGGENPFNNTVDDSDLPTPGGGGDMGGFEALPSTDNGGDTPDIPLFDSDPPGGEMEFGTPGGDFEPATAPLGEDPFSLNPVDIDLIPGDQIDGGQLGAIRSIKNRGLQLQKEIEFTTNSVKPEEVKGLEIALPEEDSVGGKFADNEIELASFQETATSTKSLMPKKLDDEQVSESVSLSEAPVEQLEQSRNPLRRGTSSVASPKRVEKEAKEKSLDQGLAELAPVSEAVEELISTEPSSPSPLSASRAFATVTSSRSLRETLRKNPLRR